MDTRNDKDAVDRILAQWRRERPELDVEAMGILGRLSRLRAHLGREVDKILAEHGLNGSSFDVLATLRRSGEPYSLSPGDLLETMMVSSGTMTNRIDQLEKAGLVQRIANPQDRRSVLIALTEKGLSVVDAAVTAHVANQHRLVAHLGKEDRETLDRILRTYLSHFE